MTEEEKIIYPDLSYELVGLLFETHNNLGRYCKEKQYGDYLEQLLKENSFSYKREFVLPKSFKGEKKGRNRVDFLIEGKIIIEMKVCRRLSKKDYYQTKRYLEATNKKLALLVNFRKKNLAPKRILN